MQFGLIGEHLSYSFSAQIHGRIGELCGCPYEYELREVAPEEMEAFLATRDFLGLNVTIPYKQAVMPFLDELSPQAAAIGAVNTIVNRGGRLIGHNTDYDGFAALASYAGVSFEGSRVLVLGRGGAALSVRAVALDAGASTVTLTGRDTDFSSLTHDFDILVNATPALELPVSLDDFPCLRGVLDCIYNPLRSPLVVEARLRGLPADGGLYMLVAQAVAAAAHFAAPSPALAGSAARAALTSTIYAALLAEKQNIVYIGMPSCGKTTRARALARLLGRAFIDTDSLIEEQAGMPIPSIFEKYGEAHFRALETSVIREISRWQGCVIATGGGVVLNPSNMLLLKQNGHVVYLKAPLEVLSTGGRRPLSSDTDALRQMFEERGPLYEKWGDEVVFRLFR